MTSTWQLHRSGYLGKQEDDSTLISRSRCLSCSQCTNLIGIVYLPKEKAGQSSSNLRSLNSCFLQRLPFEIAGIWRTKGYSGRVGIVHRITLTLSSLVQILSASGHLLFCVKLKLSRLDSCCGLKAVTTRRNFAAFEERLVDFKVNTATRSSFLVLSDKDNEQSLTIPLLCIWTVNCFK